MPEVRLATRADAAELAALRFEFRAGLAPADEAREAFLRRCGSWMAEKLGDAGSSWRCWVAEHDGALVGHVWLCLLEKVPNPVAEPERHGYVTNLYVRSAYRGHGLGGRLLGAALDRCREQGVDAVILWPTPESRSLYERHGFRSETGLLELRLSGA